MTRSAALALLLIASCRCAEDPFGGGGWNSTPGSILLVTIDTLRADHLGAYGYFRDTSPFLDELAAESLLFEHAMTPMATTLPAHVSILTSTYPMRHRVVRNDVRFDPEPDLESIAQVLARNGYTTRAFVSASPLDRGTGIAAGFAAFDQPEGRELPANVTTDRVLEWMRSEQATLASKPFFVWVHYFDPHAPYAPPDGAERFAATGELRAFMKDREIPELVKRGKTSFDVVDIHNRYDAEIRFLDRELRRLFDEVKRLGLYEDTAVVVTADHGEGLWQHNWHDHGEVHAEQLHVPLLVKPPADHGTEPRRIEQIVSTVDIVPTLAAMLDLPVAEHERAQWEGADMLDESEPRAFVFSERVNRHRKGWERGDKYALTGVTFKLIARSEGEDELFDLERDPFELDDVLDEHPELAVRMRRQVQTTIAVYAHTVNTRGQNTVDDALLEKLRGLGYLD